MRTGVYSYPAIDRVYFGEPFAEAAAKEAALIGASRVFVLSGGTLARTTDVLDQLRSALGEKFAGYHDRMAAHTPRTDCVDAANKARDAGADLILAIGGGSVTDGAKMMVLCLANNVSEPDQLEQFRTKIGANGKQEQPDVAAPAVRMVSVPTTLSAGEFNFSAGCTDTERMVKQSYRHELHAPISVILDPAVTVHTPEWLWLSTGMRAVDHAVEDICSIDATPYIDGTAAQAINLLNSGLRAVKENPSNLEARLNCQTGAWLSMAGVGAKTTKGASHGIGHVLGGTANVPHGHTTCVMLPNVLTYNYEINADRQAIVSAAFGQPDRLASDIVGELVSALGQPRTLRDVGVREEQLDLIARNSMHDRCIHTNPRKITAPEQVREILDLAW